MPWRHGRLRQPRLSPSWARRDHAGLRKLPLPAARRGWLGVAASSSLPLAAPAGHRPLRSAPQWAKRCQARAGGRRGGGGAANNSSKSTVCQAMIQQRRGVWGVTVTQGRGGSASPPAKRPSQSPRTPSPSRQRARSSARSTARGTRCTVQVHSSSP